MNAVAFVFARGGSKGCPGKNVRPLGGVPLIGRAIRTAQATGRFREVIVSTDDAEIARVARSFGALTPFVRPADLAGDTSPEWLAWRHAVQFYNDHSTVGPMDLFVSVPAVAPLREPQDITGCLDLFAQHRHETDVVLTVTTPSSNPYFSMLRTDAEGLAHLAAVPPGGSVARRQDAPPVWAITPVTYVVRPDHILHGERMLAGRTRTVFVPPERAVDIDTELDFAFAEFLMARTSGTTLRAAA